MTKNIDFLPGDLISFQSSVMVDPFFYLILTRHTDIAELKNKQGKALVADYKVFDMLVNSIRDVRFDLGQREYLHVHSRVLV